MRLIFLLLLGMQASISIAGIFGYSGLADCYIGELSKAKNDGMAKVAVAECKSMFPEDDYYKSAEELGKSIFTPSRAFDCIKKYGASTSSNVSVQVIAKLCTDMYPQKKVYSPLLSAVDEQTKAEFSEAYIKTCRKKEENAPENRELSYVVIWDYCKCVAEKVADKLTKLDINELSKDDYNIASVKPKIDLAIFECTH